MQSFSSIYMSRDKSVGEISSGLYIGLLFNPRASLRELKLCRRFIASPSTVLIRFDFQPTSEIIMQKNGGR